MPQESSILLSPAEPAERNDEHLRLRDLIHRAPGAQGWLMTSRTREWLAARGNASSKTRSALSAARVYQPDADQLKSADQRLVLGMAAGISEPLDPAVREELRLLLLANPELRVEYVGRGEVLRTVTPDQQRSLLTFDVAGGRRRYFLRRLGDGEGAEHTQEFRSTLNVFKTWLDDPGARFVLSIGGGGFRLFAVPPVLKVLDTLTARSRFSEVWGCSGGALVGHVFADGFEPGVLDELGFDLAHKRHRSLTDGSSMSLAKLGLKNAMDAIRGSRTDPAIGRWMDLLEQKQPRAKRRHPRLPFYALAVNPGKSGLFALTAPEDLPDHCSDLMAACERRHAVAASTAVPFVLQSQRGIAGWADDDVWIDGSIIDENPMTLPFVKWSRERAMAPERTPERLKILLIDLNARMRESPAVAALSEVPLLGKLVVRRAARIVDMLLDSRMMTAIQVLTATPNVSVLCLKLTLGRLGLREPSDIPHVILGGRRRGSWQVISFGKGI
jgi:hypothetical protein